MKNNKDFLKKSFKEQQIILNDENRIIGIN